MHVQLLRHGFVDLAQERQKLLMAVARFAAGQYLAIEHIERCKQRRRSMADVVMRDAFDVAQSHRQHGLCAFQRLALTLLVDAQHQSVLRRVQVGPHYVAQLFDEQRIGRELVDGAKAVDCDGGSSASESNVRQREAKK